MPKIIKPIIAICGIVVVLVSLFVVPCSAIGLGGSPLVDDVNTNYGYLYAPVSVDLVASYGTEGAHVFSVSQNEVEDLRGSVSQMYSDDSDNTVIVQVSNSFTQLSNGGYSGYTDATFNIDSGVNRYVVGVTGFRLPSVWSIRSLKTGANYSPWIYLYGNTSQPITVHYTGVVYREDTRTRIAIDIYERYNANDRIFVLPQSVGDLLASTGWSNYVLLDYKAEIRGGYSAETPSANLRIGQPQNGSAVRQTPFAYEYGNSYINRFATESIEVVDASNFDFTEWLASAFGFLDVELFGNFTIGGLLAVVIGISLLLAFLKIFAGG